MAAKLAAAVQAERRDVASGLRLLPTGAAAESGSRPARPLVPFSPSRLRPPCPALPGQRRATLAPCLGSSAHPFRCASDGGRLMPVRRRLAALPAHPRRATTLPL
jgi:hypothetical protein